MGHIASCILLKDLFCIGSIYLGKENGIIVELPGERRRLALNLVEAYELRGSSEVGNILSTKGGM